MLSCRLKRVFLVYAMTTVVEVDACLRRYYKQLQYETEYNVGGTTGIFAKFCEENGIDDDSLREEIHDQETEEAILLDFDDDFPFLPNLQFDDDLAKKKYIEDILKQCYDDPNRSWKGLSPLPEFKQKLFESIQLKDIEEIKKVYLNQCPSIYYQSLTVDINLLQS